jgi:hypothetical protein
MNKWFRIIAVGVGLTFMTAGCYYDNEEDLYGNGPDNPCDTSQVSFIKDIQPIIVQMCGYNGCHGESFPSDNIALNNYDNIVNTVSPELLLSSIAHDGNASNMPKNGNKLPDCDIAKIEKWINDGQPNN